MNLDDNPHCISCATCSTLECFAGDDEYDAIRAYHDDEAAAGLDCKTDCRHCHDVTCGHHANYRPPRCECGNRCEPGWDRCDVCLEAEAAAHLAAPIED